MKFTAYSYHNRPLLALLALMVSLLHATTPSYAIEAKIGLYLPISSSEFPTLKADLETALQAADLAGIEVKTADYWLGYQQGLRLGRVGIYLAAPHYSAWAIQRHDFSPLLRLPSKLKYVITTRQNDSHFFEVSDLAQQTICTQRGLNLDYILLRNAFNQGFLSAKPMEVWSVTDEMRNDTPDCKAFSISNHLFEELDIKHPNKFIRLYQGDTFNNYAFVAHPDVDPQLSNRLKLFLKSPRAMQILQKTYRLYSSKVNLTLARKTDYPIEYTQALSAYWKYSSNSNE